MLALVETRDRHFLKVCRSIIKSLPPEEPINMLTVAQRAIMCPAPHYYCTYTYALRVLRVLRHGRLPMRRDRRLDMWREINNKVQRVMDRRGVPLGDALAYVLAFEGSSRFFIAPSTALRLVQKLVSHSSSSSVRS